MTDDSNGPEGAPTPEGRALTMIRVALLAGVLLFGGSTYVVHQNDWSPAPYPVALQYAPAIFLIIALAITIFRSWWWP